MGKMRKMGIDLAVFFFGGGGEADLTFLVFNIPTALKGWVGHAPQGRGALHIIYRFCALLNSRSGVFLIYFF
jgi:hypothetical protein